MFDYAFFFLLGWLCSLVGTVLVLKRIDPDGLIVSMFFPVFPQELPKYLEAFQQRHQKFTQASQAAKKKKKAEQEAATHTNCLQAPSAVVKQGWLERRVNMPMPMTNMKMWSRRFFVLRSHWLSIYKDDKLREPVSHVSLLGCCVRQKDYKSVPFTFEVVCEGQQQIHHLSSGVASVPAVPNLGALEFSDRSKTTQKARNTQEMEEWMAAIASAITDSRGASTLSPRRSEPTPQLVVEEAEGVRAGRSLSRCTSSEGGHDPVVNGDRGRNKSQPSLTLAPETANQIKRRRSRSRVPAPEVSASEREAINSMIAEAGDLYNPALHDDRCILRFLRARKFDIKLASDLFNSYAEWERTYQPHDIDPASVDGLIKSRLAYVGGRDKEGHPAIVINVNKFDPKAYPHETFLRYVVYILEAAIKTMLPPVEKYTIVSDFTGFKLSMVDYDLIKMIINTLGDYYPERMGATLLMNYPFSLHAIWAVVKPWIDPVSREKIQFVSKRSKLMEFFNEDELVEELGGTLGSTPDGAAIMDDLNDDVLSSSPQLPSPRA
mmetsp:Transcript_31886/g.79955  ORF Transcript_31886/g.79955 Transcript_31886/m.79955 type:complete len:548 (+) Transcript_31886:173-1816(+)